MHLVEREGRRAEEIDRVASLRARMSGRARPARTGRRIAARSATSGIFETSLYRPLPEGEDQEHHDVEDRDESSQHIPSGISRLCNDLYLADEAKEEGDDKQHAEDAEEHRDIVGYGKNNY